MRNRVAIVLAFLVLGACNTDRRELSPGGYTGFELPTPQPKPSFTLTTTDGRPFDFRKETDGQLTFLFFGYTHCPDVCPVQMAGLSAALDQLPAAVARGVRVVFVTVDPARDTPERLRQWLDAFDPKFVGLTGTHAELVRAQVAAGLLPASRDTTSNANYTVGHGAQVIAYTADNLGRVHYAFGTRQVDWLNDIPRLKAVGQERS